MRVESAGPDTAAPRDRHSRVSRHHRRKRVFVGARARAACRQVRLGGGSADVGPMATGSVGAVVQPHPVVRVRRQGGACVVASYVRNRQRLPRRSATEDDPVARVHVTVVRVAQVQAWVVRVRKRIDQRHRDRVACGCHRVNPRGEVGGLGAPHRQGRFRVREHPRAQRLPGRRLFGLGPPGGRCVHFGQLSGHRRPARPAPLRVALSLRGGHGVERAERREHPHPAQHMIEPLVGLRRIAPNVGDQLWVGLVVGLGGCWGRGVSGERGDEGDCEHTQQVLREPPPGAWARVGVSCCVHGCPLGVCVVPKPATRTPWRGQSVEGSASGGSGVHRRRPPVISVVSGP